MEVNVQFLYTVWLIFSKPVVVLSEPFSEVLVVHANAAAAATLAHTLRSIR